MGAQGRPRRRMSPAAYLGAGLAFLAVTLLTLTGSVGPELSHRLSDAWTLRSVRLTDCRSALSERVDAINHRCEVMPVPALPVAADVTVLLIADQRPPPRLWLHLDHGTVDRVDARHSLLPGLILGLPLFYLIGAVTVFRRARRWRPLDPTST